MGLDITTAEYRALAELRYRIRHFLREGDADFVWLMPQDEWDAIALN